MIPEVGKAYDGFGGSHGLVFVLRVDGSGEQWRRVYVECACGCCPMPPSDRFDAPPDEWKLPTERFWVDRAEWDAGLDKTEIAG